MKRPTFKDCLALGAATSLTVMAAISFVDDSINNAAEDLYDTHLNRAQAATTGEPTELYIVYTGGPGRVQAGLDLLRDNPTSLLAISGAAQSSTLEMITEGADVDGVDLSRILVMNRAQTTLGNAYELREVLDRTGYKSVTIVTSADHMARALQESMGHIPLDVVVRTHPVGEYSDISHSQRRVEARNMWCVTNIACSFMYEREAPLRDTAPTAP